MSVTRLLFTVTLTCIAPISALPQDSSFVTVHYPPGLSAKNVYVDYFDGKSVSRKTFDSSSEISFRRARYWRYADLVVYYPDTTYKGIWPVNPFWVGRQPADIYILPDSDGNKPFQRYRLKNAFNVGDSGLSQLNLWEKDVRDSIAMCYELAGKNNSDSLERVALALFTRVAYKELSFLRSVKDSYFRLWLFRTRLAENHLLPVDTLNNVFHTIFPDSIQKGLEGQYIEALIEKRLGPAIGKAAPHFSLRATSGKLFTSQNTLGRYVLIDFWASWCGPCVAEMPRIAALHSLFKSRQLLVISITLDATGQTFRRQLNAFT